MQIKNTEQTWGWLARALHWLIAAGIVAVIVLGLVQEEMPRGAEKSAVRAVHMAIGLLLFAAMLLRLAWRWFNKTKRLREQSKWTADRGARCVLASR